MCLNRMLGKVLAAAAFSCLVPAGAAAYDFELVPSVGVREEYNNNLYFSETDRVDSWLTTVTPSVETKYRTERFDGVLTGQLEWLNYQNASELDSTDHIVSGRFRHLITPKLRLAGTGDFRRESRPDRHFEEAGQVDESKNYRHNYGLSTEWTVTERTTTTASYAFEWLDYPVELDRDSKMHNFDIGLIQALTRFKGDTKGRLNLGYVRGDYEGLDTESYIVTVGVFRAVHELWSLLVNAGVVSTRSEFESVGEMRTTRSTGATGNATLIYKGEKTFGTFKFSHGLSPAYGHDGAALRTSAVGNVERLFLYGLAANFTAGVYRNTSDAGEFSLEEIDEQSALLRPGIRWEPSKYFKFDAAYQYRWLENRVSGNKTTQSIAYAGITLSYPLFAD